MAQRSLVVIRQLLEEIWRGIGGPTGCVAEPTRSDAVQEQHRAIQRLSQEMRWGIAAPAPEHGSRRAIRRRSEHVRAPGEPGALGGAGGAASRMRRHVDTIQHLSNAMRSLIEGVEILEDVGH